MKLKIAQIKRLLESLSKLDGYEAVVEVDGNKKVILKPYDLSGKVRWNISKNINILTDRMQGFSKVQNDLIVQISGGKNVIPKEDTEKVSEFIKQITEVVESEEDVGGLLVLSQADLKLDSDKDINPFPPTVISGLSELLN